MTLPEPFIIGLTGCAGAGKDTAANYLVRHYGFVQVSFAEAVRDMLAALCEVADLDWALFTESKLKDQPIEALGGRTARQLMQTLGTGWGRTLDLDLWVRVLERRCGIASSHPVHDRFVVSDVRFANEAQWVLKHKGLMVRIARDTADAAPVTHASEAGEASGMATDVLDNSGSVWGLHASIDSLCRQYGVTLRDY